MILLDLVFGCWHRRRTFPITVRGKLRRRTAAATVTGTYVVCLDCGREFPYDWAQMKTLASPPRNPWAIAPVAVVPGLKAARVLRWNCVSKWVGRKNSYGLRVLAAPMPAAATRDCSGGRPAASFLLSH